MAIREILKYPDPRLHRKSRPVRDFNEELRNLADDMAETMVDANGIGLAAPQVGELLRLVVVGVPDHEHQEDVKIYKVL